MNLFDNLIVILILYNGNKFKSVMTSMKNYFFSFSKIYSSCLLIWKMTSIDIKYNVIKADAKPFIL